MKVKKSQSHKAAKAPEQKTTEIHDSESAVEEVSRVREVEPDVTEAISDESKTPSAPQRSRIQQYWITAMMIFADCAVQKSPAEVFDVLARNFESTGALSWWLHRIGHAGIAKHTKGKDIVDAIRKVAHELHRELREIGKPVARY